MTKKFDIKDFSEEGGSILRERTVGYIQMVKNTLESYPLSLEHGVQKDAIQNGWDACINKNPNYVGNNWKFEFELIEKPDGSSILLMSDFGTYGLTGQMLSGDITEDEVPPEEERWARWESLALAKGQEDSLGARGQGKMILIGASCDYAIVYDSLREDGSYRMGGTQATNKSCPVFHSDGEKGKREIKKRLDLEPIDHVGTRIIIINPVEDLISSIKSGEFLSFIEETWWPIIQKLGAKITIKHNGNILQAKTPSLFPITEDTKEDKNFKTWIRENIKIKFDKKQYNIKRLCFACDLEKDMPDIHRGVAVFRAGMKINYVKFPDKIFRDKVCGYVELDEKVEKLLRKIETPNHYEFRNIGIWRKLKDEIESELQAFGNKKLGLGIDTRELEKAKRNAAENKAMNVLRTVTKDWPFGKNNKGTGGGDDEPSVSEIKLIGIKISNLEFPNSANAPRLNYDESLDGFHATIFNKTEENIKFIFKANVLSGDRTVLELDNKEIELKPNSETLAADSYSFKVTETSFPTAGEYRLRLTLTNANTKKREDEITRRFWVEVDPELRGPFDIKRLNFSEIPKPEIQKLEWILNSEGDNRQTLLYNLDHPDYQNNDSTENRLAEYLSETFCLAALQLLVRQAENDEIEEEKLKKLPFDINKLISKDPKIIYLELMKTISSIKFDIYGII
jgi:hypothetical protein